MKQQFTICDIPISQEHALKVARCCFDIHNNVFSRSIEDNEPAWIIERNRIDAKESYLFYCSIKELNLDAAEAE